MMARIPKKKIALVPTNQNGTRSMLAGRPADIEYQINRRAYELHSARGGEAGHDLEDWLRAEKEIMGT